MSNSVQQIRTLALLAILLVATFGMAHSTSAQSAQLLTTLKISPTGDAEINVDFKMPPRQYELIKGQFKNAMYLARAFNDNVAWSEIRDLQGRFMDDSSNINASLTHVGFSKPVRNGQWRIDMQDEDMTFIAIADGVAHFSSAMDSDFGAMNALVKVKFPAGSTNHEYDREKMFLSYDLIPGFEADGETEIDFELNTKDRIMSSLAKVYADEQFDNFWVARSKFENTGKSLITDLRIRHRVANLSSWSGWSKTKVVYPGQTVIDPFFPVLDIEELANFTDSRTAMVEVEYEYKVNGETIRDTDSGKLKILSRNEVVWGSRPVNDVLSWEEAFDNAPMISAAFCTSNDPVIQQVAGAVTRMAGGYTQDSDEGAIRFLQTFWEFLEINQVSYQSPPTSNFDGHLGQHVKYGRDVIRNRAGTCVDLSILWASVAKAVGLKAYIFVIPGHAFPVIELNSGELIPIETVLIQHKTFQEAYKEGVRKFKIARGDVTTDANGNYVENAGTLISADIIEMQSLGIHCLDLPRVEDGYLLKLGYQLERPQTPEPNNTRQVQQNQQNRRDVQQQDVTTTNQHSVQRVDPDPARRLVGVWTTQVGNEKSSIVMAENGAYACLFQTFDQYGNLTSEMTGKGSWTADANTFEFETERGRRQTRYRFSQDGKLLVEMDGQTFEFTRVETE